MTDPRPPFRADHVGSLLRPQTLKDARARAAKGEITPDDLRAAEDASIRDLVALQESVGLHSITDGEHRRAMWHTDFLTGFEGVTPTHSQYAVRFKGEGGETAETRSMLTVTGKIRRTRPIMVDHFAFLNAATSRTAKFCIPSPTILHMRGARKVIDQTAYPDLDQFWDDVVAGYRAEIADLAAAGCRYLQLDDVTFSYLGDADLCAQMKADGMDPDALPALYTGMINRIVADRPDGLAVTVHTCRGNHDSMWMAEGGYDPVAEAVFGGLQVDGLFLEYDTERAGDFAPLRHVRKGTKVVLGLVSSKVPALEAKDDLKRRIEAASQYVPLENLCLSPQCGFASTETGNRLTVDDEKRKLALVVEVATEVWGSAA